MVDEPDRFMRSIDESGFWEVKLFYETGTRVWYASNPELNKDKYHRKYSNSQSSCKLRVVTKNA